MANRTFPELVVTKEGGEISRKRLQDWARRMQARDQDVEDRVNVVEGDITSIYNAISAIYEELGPSNVIWEFEEAAQFDAGVTYTFIAAANAGTCVLSDTTIRGRPALRATFTNWTGGILFPIRNLELPALYAMEFTIAGYATPPDAFAIANFRNNGGAIDGLVNYRALGGATHSLYFAVADTASSTTVAFGAGVTLVAADMDDGGVPMRVEYQCPVGDANAIWVVRVYESGASSSTTSQFSSRASTSAGLPSLSGWDALTFDLAGLGFVEEGAAVTGTVDFQDIRILDLT